MRLLLIGAVESSRCALETLLAAGEEVVGVVTASAGGVNAEWVDLAAICELGKIPVRVDADTRSAAVLEWVRARKPDLILCIGWSRLLGEELLAVAPKGCLGLHPAALPRNRGRHPLIWALVLGLTETASTLFLMDEGADSGPIVVQDRIEIGAADTSRDLYDKVLAVLPDQLRRALTKIRAGEPPTPQDASQASYWRKRSAADGRIDFRMHSRTIHNLVRALTRPYPGATVRWSGADQVVWSSAVLPFDDNTVEPGRVLRLEGEQIVVKTADGAITLCEHAIDPLPVVGDYFQ